MLSFFAILVLVGFLDIVSSSSLDESVSIHVTSANENRFASEVVTAVCGACVAESAVQFFHCATNSCSEAICLIAHKIHVAVECNHRRVNFLI